MERLGNDLKAVEAAIVRDEAKLAEAKLFAPFLINMDGLERVLEQTKGRFDAYCA